MIFTQNATGALKLVGESYPFRKGGAFILGADSHNSVNGIRRFASEAGARVIYLRSGTRGGVDLAETEVRQFICKRAHELIRSPSRLFRMYSMKTHLLRMTDRKSVV